MKIKTFIFNPIRVNTYLLWDESGEAAIIDCGAYNDRERERLQSFIETEGLHPTLALNTHLHFDHILGNRFLLDAYGLKPQYNSADEAMPNLGSGGFFLPISTEHVYADHHLDDGDTVHFGNSTLQAIATPGHSPGSLSFFSEADKCVFTGDALFHLGIGRTDLWKGNYEQLIDSIRSRLLTLPDDTTVYPGHEESSTIGEEKLANPYL
jgi:glyoxylase-like metal-dependent hydrolase (beta-lactamase superfamily II)